MKKEEKEKIIKKYATKDGDTGSVEVQVGILTEKINSLAEDHFDKHPKDKHSKRGLLGMVNKRRKLLEYLKRISVDRYNKLAVKIGIKKIEDDKK